MRFFEKRLFTLSGEAGRVLKTVFAADDFARIFFDQISGDQDNFSCGKQGGRSESRHFVLTFFSFLVVQQHVEAPILWFSSGNTTSVVHHDGDQDNLNCVLAGRKKVNMWSRR